MIRIVQFKDGYYGVKKGFWRYSSYLATDSNCFYSTEAFISRYCKFNTLDECEKALERYLKETTYEVRNKTIKWL